MPLASKCCNSVLTKNTAMHWQVPADMKTTVTMWETQNCYTNSQINPLPGVVLVNDLRTLGICPCQRSVFWMFGFSEQMYPCLPISIMTQHSVGISLNREVPNQVGISPPTKVNHTLYFTSNTYYTI
jgi:hypothetical protein